MHKYIIISLLFFLPVSGICQETNLPEVITSIAEELASDETDSEANTLLIEKLQELTENPVRINTTDESEISRLFFLSEFQSRTLIDYIKSSGKIISVYEIAVIPGFDRQTAEMMTPFITLDAGTQKSGEPAKWRNTLLTNLIIKPGQNDSSSLGSQLKLLAKYKFTSGNFSGGVTCEKDPGEKFLTGTPALPDFLSAYFSYSGKGIIKKIILGDFSIRFGQGTNINTGLRTSLALTAQAYMPGRDEIRPYTSTDENNFLRGTAAEFSFKKIGLSLFYSKNIIDATLGISADSNSYYVENLYSAGLHNTSSLFLKKDVLTSTIYGINLTYNFKSLRVGFMWSDTRFTLPINPDHKKSENLYDFEGSKNSIYSIYFNSQIRRFLMYGELSGNNATNIALVQGVTLRPSDRLTVNFLYRYYTPGFASFNGRGPGTGTSTNNEYGILGNFTFEAAKHLFISAGCDISYFPWLKYRCSFPSMGKREEVKLKYTPNEKLVIDMSYNFRLLMLNSQTENGIPEISENKARTFKCVVKYSPDERLSLSARIDYKIAAPSGSRGMLMLQDIIYRFRKAPLSIWFRYCIFNTDDWNSRLYTYENDLLFSFSIPALSGEGSRSYVMAKWEFGNFAEIRFKYGLTTLVERNNYSENKNDVKVQFRIWF